MSTEFDLSVVVTAHDETLVSGPSMAAADAAIANARAAGISVEPIIVLDCATPETTAWFSQPALSHWQVMVQDQGDLGRVRNAVVPQTKGRFIAFLDADDIFSENWLKRGVDRLRAAEADGMRAIVHPELNWLFDGAHAVFWKPDQTDPLFSSWHFYFMNYYDSLCMAPRAAHLDHPYVARDIPAGLSFQDWQFSIETMGAGWVHLNAPDTVIFKRRRDASLVTESRARRALVRQLPEMAIDKVDHLGGTKPQASWGKRLKSALTRAKPGGVPELETPHSGAVFAARVARAKARRGTVKDSDLYDRIAPHFDHAYYLAANPDLIDLEDVDPIAHYIRAGAREGRNPSPFFSTRAWVARNPDLGETRENPFDHWLSAGQPPCPMAGFDGVAATIGKSTKEAFALWRTRYADLHARLEHGALGQEVNRACAHEPLIGMGWLEALLVKVPPFHNDEVASRTAAIHALAQAAGGRRASHVICVNRPRFGGALRVEGHIARVLAEAHGAENVVVITTEHPGDMPAGKLPQGVRHVDFAALVPDLKGDPRQRVLAEFLRALCPRAVFNVNSALFWNMLTPYGTALAASMRLYASLLCNEQTRTGHWTGYPLRRFYRHFDQLSGVLTDSRFLADELINRHMIPADQQARVQVLPNPVDVSIPVAARPAPGNRPQIFWAGRFDPQKRIDLAYAIARALPDCDLHMWGETVMGAGVLPDKPDNVIHQGSYARFADLPLGDCDLWLYTSAWDGVPSMLLEVAMTGIPILGSDVGGTGEVLQNAMPPEATPEDWAKAIRALLADPDSARAQALDLRAALISTRSQSAHAAVLTALPGCSPEDPA